MNPSLRDSVLDLFRTIDQTTAALRERAALACATGCGTCCLSKHIEVTALDLVPLVSAFMETGRFEQLATAALAVAPASPCLFYSPVPQVGSSGCCTVYDHRPSTCRLFGFAVARDKAGMPYLATCSKIRANKPGEILLAGAGLAADGISLSFRDVSMQLMGIDPELGGRRMHINDALKYLVMREGLKLAYAPMDDDEPTKPHVPRRPPRAA
jgi:Fe-S-cluster containining protein